MKEAIIYGVDLIGYTPGYVSTFLASTGEMKKRYGFIYVDKDNDGNGTLNRTKRSHLNGIRELFHQTVET